VTATGIGFEAPATERYLGFGERSTGVDQRGREVENRVSDGPYQEHERPFIASFVPPAGFSDRDDATYFPMPWLLSTAGYGVLVENLEDSLFRLATDRDDAWSLEAEASELSLIVFAGPEPADVVRRLTKFTGRQPAPAAPWFFGPWYQPHGEQTEAEQARMLRREDVPGSAANTYLHYLPCGDQQGVEAEQPPRTGAFHEQGYAVTTYFNPMICVDYQPAYGEATAAGVLTETAGGLPATYKYSASTDDLFLVGQFDFSDPAADSFFAGLLGEAVADGYDGWMEDFGEYTPAGAVSHNGMSAAQMHNYYPVVYHRSSWRFAREQERPVAGFIRSGWTGVHPYAQLVWGGDPTTGWGFDGLTSAVHQALSLGTSGISRWGSDIGGFFALGANRLSDELLVRWIQFGAASPLMRTQANGVSLPPQDDRPQITDPEILPLWRRYAKLHTQLYPYLLAADATYRRSGMPAMRHLALAYPDRPELADVEDQFMLGPSILVAPVLEPGATERTLELPPGRWVDLWRSAAYRERRGNLRLRGAELLRGGGRVTVPAPLEELPMLVRAGSVIPMLPAAVDTLAGYGAGARGVVRLADRRRRLELLAFPRGRSAAPVGEGGRVVSKADRRGWRLLLEGSGSKRYRLRASLATLRRPFEPCAVTLGGRPLPERRWSYRPGGRLLDVRFGAGGRRTALRVERRCGG
jgi:alpha-glucosidase